MKQRRWGAPVLLLELNWRAIPGRLCLLTAANVCALLVSACEQCLSSLAASALYPSRFSFRLAAIVKNDRSRQAVQGLLSTANGTLQMKPMAEILATGAQRRYTGSAEVGPSIRFQS
jgi:hypothetical protein